MAQMAIPREVEGELHFETPSTKQPATTWYKLIGGLETPPIIAIHGGPGAGHEYLAPIADLYDKYKTPVIFYDQVGCGRSTHFSDKNGDTTFWTFDLFLTELENLVTQLKLHDLGFYILGQSWGGMLAATYASGRPAGLRKLILANAPASMPLFSAGCKQLLSKFPEDIRNTIEECERNEEYENPEYEKACEAFYVQHLCRLDPFPESLMKSLGHLKEDPSTYHTM